VAGEEHTMSCGTDCVCSGVMLIHSCAVVKVFFVLIFNHETTRLKAWERANRR